MRQTNYFTAGATALTLAFFPGVASADDDKVYVGFPVTVKGYSGDKTSSVSYSGQIARHALHDSLKKLAGKGNGSANADLKASMMSYYAGKDEGREIIAPTTKGAFKIKQTTIAEISKNRELAGKTFGGAVTGMPNAPTGAELVKFWIDKASSADGGQDLRNGYDYPQLISKFIMGAVSYNQAVDGYLDENLEADKKPNDKPYGDGDPYTGKEHSWDEAFGYFGAPVHTLNLTPQQVYDIAKQKEDVFKTADYNGDGVIDLKTEYTFGPAYYAAGFDASVYDQANKKTEYLHTITKAFLDGRKLIRDAKGEKLTDAQRSELKGYAATIAETWEKVLAEAVFKYAGSVYKDMVMLQTIMEANGETDKMLKNYVKHWGELKGFALALQTGTKNLGETATSLNRMIGFGPLMLDSSQVVDIDSDGNYLRDQGPAWGEYQLHMAKIQQLMINEFDVRARNNDITDEMAALTDKLGPKTSAEND